MALLALVNKPFDLACRDAQACADDERQSFAVIAEGDGEGRLNFIPVPLITVDPGVDQVVFTAHPGVADA